MNTTLDLSADIIDVRDIIARVELLRDERDGYIHADGSPCPSCWAVDCPEDAEELDTLTAILDNLAGYGGDEQWRGDWYPVTLIRDSYFVDYCEELVKDIGDLPNDIPSYLAIDWDATADNLRVDYSSVDVDGDTYWYR